jgi:sulfate adenylyltransferase subunit 2
MGKDSNVFIWLARKFFLGQNPVPPLHIDTIYEFPLMLECRDWAIKYYNF